MLTIFCEGLRPRLTPRWRGAFDFGCSPQGANKNAPPNGVCTARQACALGCEGIVSKRLGSAYRSGRADCWLEVKNPKCARGHARSRRGLELLSHGSARSIRPRRLPEPPFRRTTFPLMQPSPIWQSGRPAHCPFRGLLGVHSRYGLHTRAVTVYRDSLSEGFSHLVTS